MRGPFFSGVLVHFIRFDVSALQGTGPEGRIVREDVEQALAARGPGTPPTMPHEVKKVKATLPLKGIRRRIAGFCFGLSA